MKKIIFAMLVFFLVIPMTLHAEESALMNVAKGKIVTHWSTLNATPVSTDMLSDGLASTNAFVNIGDTGWSNEEKYKVYYQIDLLESYDITGMTLTPYLGRKAGSSFPKQFEIQISDSATFENYTVLHAQTTDYYEDLYTLNDWKDTTMIKVPTGPDAPQKFSLEGTGRYVRIYITKNATYAPEVTGQKGQCGSGFSEIELWVVRGAELVKSAAKSAFAWTDYRPDKVSGENLIDGSFTTYTQTNCGDTSWARADQYKAYFLVDLGKSREIAQVKLMPRVVPFGGTFPQRFEIQVSDDEDFATYDVVYNQLTDYYDNPNIWKGDTTTPKVPVGPTTEQVFDVTGYGRYVRICSTKHPASYETAATAKGYIVPSLAEISIYTAAVCELENAYYNQNGEEISGNDLSDITELTVETVIYNETRMEDDGILIYAIYKGGVLKAAEINDVNISASINEQNPRTFVLNYSGEGEYEVKTFLWKGRTNIRPLCDEVNFPQR